MSAPDCKPCPFCRSVKLQTTKSRLWRGPVQRYRLRVVCLACRATGPKASTRAAAEALWNARVS